MSYLRFDKATASERELLALLRASAWAKELSSEEFTKRNQRLYSHQFGSERIDTFVIRNLENKIVTSMDVLRVKFFFKAGPKASISVKEGFLIASVFTAPQHRRKGYAALMMSRFFEQQKWDLGVLYSDIGPKFYEKWGFQKTHRFLCEMGGPFPKNQLTINPIEPKAWVDKVFDLRKSNFDSDPKGQMALVPDVDFLDWHLERFRFFAQLKGRGPLPPTFFELETSQGRTYFAVVLNAMTQKAEVLWRDSNSEHSLTAIGQVVESWGLKEFTFWSPNAQGKVLEEECPMGWFQGQVKPEPEGFFDPQICDWW
ncbi:MAG: GNAT family N-acetyltransferase [Deltaproteobacteria bacterium]